MAYVNVPNDLSKIKTKMAFNLTKRQLLCFGAAAVVGIPAYLLTRSAIGNSPALFLMIGLMLPAFLLAMYERDGLPFEKVVRNFARSRFLWPWARPYKTDNFYGVLSNYDKEVQGLDANKKAKNPAAKRQTQTSRSPNGAADHPLP